MTPGEVRRLKLRAAQHELETVREQNLTTAERGEAQQARIAHLNGYISQLQDDPSAANGKV